MESSLHHKEEGNKSFAQKDISSAINSYRRGLCALPPHDADIPINQKDEEERTKCEVALRSNLALCLIRVAEGSNGRGKSSKEREGEVRGNLIEAARECSEAILLEPKNAKLWYRRGQASLLLVQCEGNNGSVAVGATDEESQDPSSLLSRAETDMKECESLLQGQLEKLKYEKTPTNVTRGVISQIVEARKALKRIDAEKKRCEIDEPQQQGEGHVSSDSSSGNNGSREVQSESQSQSKEEDNVKPNEVESRKQAKHASSQRNGLIASFKTSRSSRTAASQGKDANGAVGLAPPVEQQKEQIVQLLSRRAVNESEATTVSEEQEQQLQQQNQTIYPPQKGEAYFLIEMSWWEHWCHYVNFFHSYKHIKEEDKDVLKQRIKEVDDENAKILSCLPPRATLPPYLEREKKDTLAQAEDKKSSSSSSSSEMSSDESEGEAVPPGPIDNTILILDANGSWLPNLHFDNNNNETSESKVSLKSNLVRGHHFEILPRETYAALRSWYGEASTPILRRVQSVPWLKSPTIPIYPDRWEYINNKSSYATASTLNTCLACRSPHAKSKCTKCKTARYCSKDCQKSHWPYHKVQCWNLVKQKFGSEGMNKRVLVPEDRVWGRVGLNNLGNTCFMSSALQCMSHVTPLTRLFLSNAYLSTINENNINGTGGKVANAYGSLLKDLWMGSHQHSSLSPTVLKRAIELFAPQFYGVQQQDSAEFLSYLLDALHEDLNRVRDAPYVVMPEVEGGRKLSVCGAETWDALCRRNSSYIFENFYGLYKSTCVCPQCETVSVTFDTFNHITLEIPRIAKLDFGIVLIRDHTGDEEPALPVKYCVSVPQTGTVSDLKISLGNMSGVPASRLDICNVVIDKCSISQLYRGDISVSSLTNEELLVAYEVAPLEDATKVNAVVVHTVDSSVFGLPLLVSFNRNVICSEVYNRLWKYVKPFVMLGCKESENGNSFLDQVKSCLRIRVTDASGKNDRMLRTGFDSESTSILPPTSNKTVAELMGLKDKEKFVFFALEYSNVIANTDDFDKKCQIYSGNFLMVSNHSSMVEYSSRVNRMHESTAVTLDQCFESFTQPERLDDDNMWYCSKCKEHVKAMKSVAMWRLPNILVIHLKRFEYRNSFDRSKIGTLVDFPIDGFDMKKHSAHDSPVSSNSQNPPDLVNEEAPNIYDLFGVTNHYGRMGYGHYTAYTRRFNEFGIEDRWSEFDDENVSEVDGNGIVSPSAYVLFYRRRTLL